MAKKMAALGHPSTLQIPLVAKTCTMTRTSLQSTGIIGCIKYLVRWQGYGEADDTWKSPAHLSDALEYVASWNEDKKKCDAEAEVQRQKKKQKAQVGSSSSNADALQTAQIGPQRKQTSPVWKASREATPGEGGKDFAICQVKKLNGALCR